MNVSRPAVHPIEVPPPLPNPPAAVAANNNNNDDANNQNLPWIKDIQGMPGTLGGLALRFFQFMFAAAALCVMVTTSDFTSVTAFCYLVAVAILQSSWSLSLAFVDVYAILVGRCLQNPRVVCLFTVGDGNAPPEKRIPLFISLFTPPPSSTAAAFKWGNVSGEGSRSNSESADDFERRLFGGGTDDGSSNNSFFQKIDRIERTRGKSQFDFGSNLADDGFDSLRDGLDSKLRNAAERNDPYEIVGEDYQYRPDMMFTHGTYDIKDLDLTKPTT